MAHEGIGWSPEALDDVERIAEYIGKDSPTHAAGMVKRLFAAVEDLELFPRMGRAIPEVDDPAYRDLIVGQYRLIYRLDGDQVLVIGVVHGARLLTRAIGDRLPRNRRRKRE